MDSVLSVACVVISCMSSIFFISLLSSSLLQRLIGIFLDLLRAARISASNASISSLMSLCNMASFSELLMIFDAELLRGKI